MERSLHDGEQDEDGISRVRRVHPHFHQEGRDEHLDKVTPRKRHRIRQRHSEELAGDPVSDHTKEDLVSRNLLDGVVLPQELDDVANGDLVLLAQLEQVAHDLESQCLLVHVLQVVLVDLVLDAVADQEHKLGVQLQGLKVGDQTELGGDVGGDFIFQRQRLEVVLQINHVQCIHFHSGSGKKRVRRRKREEKKFEKDRSRKSEKKIVFVESVFDNSLANKNNSCPGTFSFSFRSDFPSYSNAVRKARVHFFFPPLGSRP